MNPYNNYPNSQVDFHSQSEHPGSHHLFQLHKYSIQGIHFRIINFVKNKFVIKVEYPSSYRLQLFTE
jgi:hypothetical protein